MSTGHFLSAPSCPHKEALHFEGLFAFIGGTLLLWRAIQAPSGPFAKNVHWTFSLRFVLPAQRSSSF
jgi:hypothetical protein